MARGWDELRPVHTVIKIRHLIASPGKFVSLAPICETKPPLSPSQSFSQVLGGGGGGGDGKESSRVWRLRLGRRWLEPLCVMCMCRMVVNVSLCGGLPSPLGKNNNNNKPRSGELHPCRVVRTCMHTLSTYAFHVMRKKRLPRSANTATDPRAESYAPVSWMQ
jgi:hypothetical protein